MQGRPNDGRALGLHPPAELPSWRALLVIFGRKVAAEAISSVEGLARLGERARERRALAALDDRMIQDIGIDRARIWGELSKPVWRD